MGSGTPRGPFNVDLTRSDRSGSETASFAVTRTGDPVELSTFKVSDLTGTSQQEQTITFEPDDDFGSKERVSIDLTDAEMGNVDYGQDVAVTGGSGEEAEMKVVDDEDVVYVTYTAPDGGFGDEVKLMLLEVTPTGTGNTYEVGVSRGSAGTDSTTFDVQEPPFFEVEITDTNSPVTEGETLTVDVNVTNTGDVSDTQTLNLTDSGFNGTERDTVDVTLAGGESDDSITLEWETSGGDAGSGSVAVFSDNDSDAETVTVDARQASSVQRVPGSATAPGGGGTGKLQFQFNTSAEVNLTAAAIETTGSLDSAGTRGDAKFTIAGEDSTDAQDTDGNLVYEYPGGLVLTEADGDIQAEFNQLDSGIESLEFVDESAANVIITFQFDDGSTKEFYLEAQE